MPIRSGTGTPSRTMTLYSSYSVLAMNGVSPKRRQKSVTPSAQTSMPLPIVGRVRGWFGSGVGSGGEMMVDVRRAVGVPDEVDPPGELTRLAECASLCAK